MEFWVEGEWPQSTTGTVQRGYDCRASVPVQGTLQPSVARPNLEMI